MSEVVKHGVIVIDLKMGKVEIQAPELNKLLQFREQELGVLTEQANVTEALVNSQQQIAQLAKETAGAKAAAQQAEETKKTQAATMGLTQSLEKAGEGVFRLGRATVLLGAQSDESFQKMIRDLAMVQAGFDLFKGSQQVIRGVTAAVDAMAASQTRAATTGVAAAGALNPLTAGLAVLGVTVGVAALAWQKYADAQRKAAAAAEEYQRQQREADDIAMSVSNNEEKAAILEKRIASNRNQMFSERFERETVRYSESGSFSLRTPEPYTMGKEQKLESLEREQKLIEQIAADEAALAQIATQQASEAEAKAQSREREINQQQELLKRERELLETARQNAIAVEAKIGSLSPMERRQLAGARDAANGGRSLTPQQEEILLKAGLSGAVDAQRAQLARSEGLSAESFQGAEGSVSRMGKDAQDLAQELRETRESFKKLNGQGGAATIAELESERQALKSAYASAIAEGKQAVLSIVDELRAVNREVLELKQAAADNAL